MDDLAALSKTQLIDLLAQQDAQLQTKDDVIKQLEQKNQELELAYRKLWLERFAARSERYLADPDQLRIDFGDTDEAADAAAGLAEAIEEADLIPAHQRRKPRKKRDEGLPEHLPRYEFIADDEEQAVCPTHGPREIIGYDTTDSWVGMGSEQTFPGQAERMGHANMIETGKTHQSDGLAAFPEGFSNEIWRASLSPGASRSRRSITSLNACTSSNRLYTEANLT